MPEKVKELGVDLEKAKSIDMREFIYNMPTVMAAADVVISRAGSSSCNEIAATGTPCVLIPSPNVTDNHQEKNARALEAQGGAVVILEEECTGARLMQEVNAILSDPHRQAGMRKALHTMAVPDSAQLICDELERLAAKE
jgi:UDP-N-acetylglucosamine--N-acetylmuramyl-(pentapeptide) pyrophosphoryl-undecaprenol N-acetylglucosamine transferase